MKVIVDVDSKIIKIDNDIYFGQTKAPNIGDYCQICALNDYCEHLDSSPLCEPFDACFFSNGPIVVIDAESVSNITKIPQENDQYDLYYTNC